MKLLRRPNCTSKAQRRLFRKHPSWPPGVSAFFHNDINPAGQVSCRGRGILLRQPSSSGGPPVFDRPPTPLARRPRSQKHTSTPHALCRRASSSAVQEAKRASPLGEFDFWRKTLPNYRSARVRFLRTEENAATRRHGNRSPPHEAGAGRVAVVTASALAIN